MKVSHVLTQVRSLNNIHALVRSIVTYAVCIPLAAVIGYMLTKPLSFGEAALYCILLFILIFPLVTRAHYPLMLLAFNLPVSLFFIKTSPSIGMVMIVVSLGVSIFDRILTRQTKFLTVPEMNLPIIAFLAVVIFTAEMTGGFGFRAFGSEVYGGKKYVFLLMGIAGFFAITARPIPAEKVNLYLGLFLLGGVLNVLSDMVSVLPSGLHFIYLLVPASAAGMDAMGNYSGLGNDIGSARLGGTGTAAGAFFGWMLFRYGVRGMFVAKHPWRLLLLFACLCLISFGGFRSSIMVAVFTFMILFFLEKLHQTPMLFIFMLLAIFMAAMMLPFASKLPLVVQRSLAFLPLDLDPEAIASAQSSTEWRIALWTSMAQEIPKYFFLGKGFAITMEDWNSVQSSSALMRGTISAENDPLAISSDFHNGPLSVIIPFGIWGVLAFVWMMVVCLWLVSRNQRYGAPHLKLANNFLMTSVIVKLLIFLTVFGAIAGDLSVILSFAGLSVAINHGVAKPGSQMAGKPVLRGQPPSGRFVRPRPAMARQSLSG